YRDLWETITRGGTWSGRLVNRKKDGTLYTSEGTVSPLRMPMGDTLNYVAVKRDITRELELEAQFLQAQKMDAVGQLAGGVAHDFNNLLQVMAGYTGLAMDELEEGHRACESLGEVANAASRAAALVAQLLTFSRCRTMHPENLDVNGVVSDLMKMLQRVIGETVRLDFVPDARPMMVRADRGMLEQVLVNLSINARDAMPEGGVLTVRTESLRVDAADCSLLPEITLGPYVLVSVADTGCGMDDETQKRIFEPFFTTKQPGKGTGLGLATVYGIVQQHKGAIQCTSEPGKGTTFRVYLPLAEVESATGTEETAQALRRGGTETILVGEDNEQVRGLTTAILTRAGYTVLEANDGVEAVALFDAHRGEIDLVLLDAIMPEMSGIQAYEHMIAVQPDVKVLFATGYAETAVEARLHQRGELALIQKPYAISALLQAVRDALDKKR
ncbi:MAG: response regulator, partial [Candidatus Hydrogenedentes bacterium]|nr:response regulator [Candidatus Hydrogenedentota bacterium]